MSVRIFGHFEQFPTFSARRAPCSAPSCTPDAWTNGPYMTWVLWILVTIPRVPRGRSEAIFVKVLARSEEVPPPPPRGPRHPGGSAVRPIRYAPPHRHPPAPTMFSKGWQSCAGAQGHPADRIGGQHADTNRNSMETTPSKNSGTPMTPALVPAQERQRDGPR